METAGAQHNSRKNPYIGPRSFEFGEMLYGRDVETRDLVSLLCAERIVLLHSPSGAGKTSLIQAALVPRMEARKFYVRPVARVNRERIQAKHAGSTNRYIFSLLSSFESAISEEEQIPDEELSGMTLEEYRVRRPKPSGVLFELFIFDQFEEIITINPADQEQKMAFFAQIGKLLVDDTCWVLFSMREDFLGALDPYLKYIPDRLAATFRLDLLGVKAAAQALQRPAQVAGVTFADVAVEQLLNDLRLVQVQCPDGRIELQPGPYIEPVQLQVVAYRLWESLAPDDNCIGVDDLAALGDVGQALSAYYAQQVNTIAAQTGVSERAIREWFDRRLISEGSTRSQVRLGAEQSEGLANTAVRLLENAHLIRAEKRGGAIWYELAHDRLINPVYQDNVDWFNLHLSLLQRQAALWEEQRRPEGLLLRDKELAQAEAWAQRHTMLPVEQEFLDACRQAQKQAVRERQMNARLRTLLILACAAAAVSVIMAVFSIQQSQKVGEIAALVNLQRATANAASTQAIEQRDRARVSQLAAQALTYQVRQLDLALLFSVEAFRRQNNYQTRNSLLSALEESAGLLAILPGNHSAVFSMTLSPDGKILATGSADGTIMIWDTTTRQQLGESLIGHNDFVYSLAFSPDGKLLASGSRDKKIILWDLATHQPITEPLQKQEDAVSSVAFSPDGKILASGSWDGSIVLWDVGAYSPLDLAPMEDENIVSSLAFSPDGKKLASGSYDSTITFWDVATGQPLDKIDGHQNGINSLAFSPDGSMLASASTDKTIRIWDVSTRQPLGKPLEGHTSSVESVAFSSDGKTLASGSADTTIILWDVATGTQLGKPLTGHTGYVLSLAFSLDGKTLFSGSWDKTILMWDVPKRQMLGECLQASNGRISALAFSPDSEMIAAGVDSNITFWDAATHQPLGTPLEGTEDRVLSIAFSPDGKILASGNYRSSITLWDVTTRQPLFEPFVGHQSVINGVAFSPDGKLLASAGDDYAVIVWDLSTRPPHGQPLSGHTDRVHGVAFSPDGKILASVSSDHTLILWDVASHEMIRKLDRGHQYPIASLDFSPDGQLLVTGSSDGTVRLWDVHKRQPIGDPLEGHKTAVNSVVFSPDGKYFASGSRDHTVILWDAETRQPYGRPLEAYEFEVKNVDFAPDGKSLAASGNGCIITWDIDPALWMERACQVANRNLTEQEWQQYIGEDEMYRKTCPKNP